MQERYKDIKRGGITELFGDHHPGVFHQKLDLGAQFGRMRGNRRDRDQAMYRYLASVERRALEEKWDTLP